MELTSMDYESGGGSDFPYADDNPDEAEQMFNKETKALESLKMRVKWREDKPHLLIKATDIKDIKHPCTLQFAISSKKMKEFFLYKLENHDIKFTSEEILSGTLEVDVSSKNFLTEVDVQDHITKAFSETTIKDIDYLKITKSSENFDMLKKSKSGKLKDLRKDEKIMLFDSKETVYLVGDEKNLALIEQELNLHKQNRIPVRCGYPWSILKSLKIEQYLTKHGVEVTYEIQEESPVVVVVGTTDNVKKAEMYIHDFCADVKIWNLALRSKEHKCLLSQNDKERNVNLEAHFKKVLSVKQIRCNVKIDKYNGEYSVFATCKGEDNAKKAEQAVSDSIDDHNFTHDQMLWIEDLIKQWEEKSKLKIIKLDEKGYKIICTRDVSNEILKALKDTDNEPLLPIVSNFLETHGRENLDKLAKRHDVSFKIEDCCLKMHGLMNNIAKFKQEYLKEFTVDVSCMESLPDFDCEHEEMIKEIANSNQCCFQPNYREKQKESSPDNCGPVVTWSHGHVPVQITLMSGDFEDVQTDCRILFVTDKQFPLSIFRKENSVMKDALLKRFPQHGVKSKKPGEILNIKELSYPGKCETRAIVLCMSNYSKDELDDKQIEAAVIAVLNDCIRKGAESVIVPLDLAHEKFPPALIAKACVNAMMSISPNKSSPHLYVFGNDDKKVEMAQTIDKICQEKKRRFYRDVHLNDIKFKQGFQRLRWSVEKASLLDKKTDVIVNTVVGNLDLKVGKLSKQILERAGDIVQEECISKYPQGLKEGELAVTSAGRLSARYIFHCALPEFNKTKNNDNIKSMVRLCLQTMDIRNLKSIAFPAFGTGKLGYPGRETSKAMLDAIEEYQYSAINSVVEEVVIVMHESDDHMYKIFSQAKKNRQMMGKQVEDQTVFVGLNIEVGPNENRVQLNLARESDLKQLSSTVVEVGFTGKQRIIPVMQEYSYENPDRKRDQLKVYMAKPYDLLAFTAAIKLLLQYCKINKISEIIIKTLKTGVACSALEQVKAIQKEVVNRAKTEKKDCLSNVYIVLPDTEALEYMEKELNSAQSFSFYSPFSSKVFWKCNSFDDVIVEMVVVGKTDDSVQKTKAEIKRAVQTLSEGGDKQNNEMKELTEGKHKFTEVPKTHNKEEDVYNQMDSVSAELNPGIVGLLIEKKCFDQWKTKVETKYSVCIQDKNNGRGVFVEGTFDCICSFENYLDHIFPNDSDFFKFPLKSDGATSKPSKASEKPKPPMTAMDNETEEMITKVSISEAEPFSPKPEVQVVNVSDTDADKIQIREFDVEYSFMVDNLNTRLIVGDLTKLNVDCLVCSANESLVLNGLLGIVAKAAGPEFQDECRKEIKENGKLKVGECLPMESGCLPCKKVIHVMAPSWNIEKENQLEILDSMEAVLTDCFLMADELEFKSLALPLIGTGINKFPVAFLAQQYSRALKIFSQKRKHVTDIYIVEMEKSKLASFVTEIKNYSPIKDLPSAHSDGKENLKFPIPTTFPLTTSTFISCRKGTVQLYMAVGSMTAVQIEAIVSSEDQSFSGRSGIAKDVLALGSQSYRDAHKALGEKAGEAKPEVGTVWETESGNGQLLCKYVLHTFVPRRNREYCRAANKLEADIKTTIFNVLSKGTELKCRSLAIPFLGTSEEIDINTPVETCCKAIIDGIEKFLQTKETTLNRIEFICTDPGVVQAFRDEMLQRKKEKMPNKPGFYVAL